MPVESVVDALMKAHEALRPDGVLLDCHPVAESLAVRAGKETTQLGPREYSPAFAHAVANAGQALSSVSNNGAFLKLEQMEYVVTVHFSSYAEWTSTGPVRWNTTPSQKTERLNICANC
jgi:hypothetical protein